MGKVLRVRRPVWAKRKPDTNKDVFVVSSRNMIKMGEKLMVELVEFKEAAIFQGEPDDFGADSIDAAMRTIRTFVALEKRKNYA